MTAAGHDPKVFSIPAGAPFLPTLVDALLDGVLIPGRRFRDDPLSLSDVTLFLPTRRAARALGSAFLEALGGQAALLPRIRPLGDLDDGLLDPLADPSDLEIPPAVSEAERLLGLSRLVGEWRRLVTADRLVTPAGETIRVPSSTADAVRLAADLIGLMDQAAVESVDWTRLKDLVPDDYAGWWQMTLTFLTIAIDAWPAHLAESGRLDPASRRVQVLEKLAERLERDGARGPVIAAGSTGSLATTARLIRAIARQKEGAVVLPGLDLAVDDATFAAIGPDPIGRLQTPSHPQATMARLLSVIGVSRAAVTEVGSVPAPLVRRARIVGEALRPADETDRWQATSAALLSDEADANACRPDERAGGTSALDGLTLIEATGEAEEALAIAIALRETIKTPGRTAALVTPDRGLARRVCTELARFDVDVEDSAGTPLARTPQGVLGLLAASAVAEGAPPDKVVALLKHPLTALGWERPRTRAAARALELAVLRGPRLTSGFSSLAGAAARQAHADREGPGVHPAFRHLGEARCRDAREIARRLAAATLPMEGLFGEDLSGGERHDLRHFLEAHLALLRALAEDEDGDDWRLFEGPAGTALAELFAGFLDATSDPLTLTGREYPATFATLMQGRMVRRPPAHPARVFIWGALEARLMTVDRVVLGGLNEGVWPSAADTGPWLSRPMRAGLAFSPPEVRIGLSAHDFAQALGREEVVLTRSLKREGAPTVPSRFLQRFGAVIGKTRMTALRARGTRYLDWARRLDDGRPATSIVRPDPRPPVESRPTSLSVTEIETWIRDPYALYARRILKLEPVEPLGSRPDFGDRGTAVHQALRDFAEIYRGPFDENAVSALVGLGKNAFRELEAYPEVYALWWPRFVAAADFVVKSFEAERGDIRRHAEVKGDWTVPGGGGFTLRGRADRIDVLSDGRLSIVDFKTGTAPSGRQIATMQTPQLPLEAAIALGGGFQGIPADAGVAELVHVVLKGVRGKDEIRSFAGYAGRDLTRTLPEVITLAVESLTGLIRAYQDPEKGYLSRAHPFRARETGRYDHLARVREWSLGEGEGGDE